MIVLREPREKVLGVIEGIDDAGIFIRAIDLNYFEEWTRAIRNDEPYLPMQDLFYPMWRVERISRDAESAGVPSMADQFEQKTGLSITDL